MKQAPLRKLHSFALSGCGWLTPFHLGVAKELQASGFVSADTTVAGTSGGALGAMAMVSGIKVEDTLEALIDFGNRPHLHKNIEANMRMVMLDLLSSTDKGEAALKHCNGRLIVCVTRLWPETSIKPIQIQHYPSLPFLVDVVGASCFIPFWSAPKLYTTVAVDAAAARAVGFAAGETALVDGGFLAFMPPVGDTRVSPFPRRMIIQSRSKPHISLPQNAYRITELLSWVLAPAPEPILRELYVHGREAAAAWVKETRVKATGAT